MSQYKKGKGPGKNLRATRKLREMKTNRFHEKPPHPLLSLEKV
jgi:hypothetical protein